MIIVRYSADGMKSVVRTEQSMSMFWQHFRDTLRDADRHEEVSVYKTSGRSFEVVDERLASGCTQYVARPDDWEINNGEPK